MLQIYRRHYPPCRHRSRRFKKCKCPIWVQGSLRGEYVRQALDLRSWEAASDLVRGWEASGSIGVVKTEAPDVRGAVDKFLAWQESRGLKESSLKKYRALLKTKLVDFATTTGRVRLNQLTVEALRDFVVGWKVAAITQSKDLETLKAFLRFCESSGWIATEPWKALKAPRVTQDPTLPLPDADFKKLLAACAKYRGNGARLRAMLLLLRNSGLRIGDAVGLERARVDAKKRLQLYTQKTGTPVHVPLPDDVIAALAKVDGSATYFFWSGNGKIKSAIEDWRRSFNAVAELAGVEGFHPHRLRDSFSVALLEKGVPVETVAELLGNTPQIVQKHYSPWIQSRQIALEEAVRQTWSAARA